MAWIILFQVAVVPAGAVTVPPPSGDRVVVEADSSILDNIGWALLRAADFGYGLIQSAGSAVAAVPDAIGSLRERLSSTASSISQFAWEVAYVLGANGTPVTAVPITDAHDKPPERKFAFRDGDPAPPPAQGGASAPATPPTPAPVPQPVAEAPPAPVPAAPVAAPVEEEPKAPAVDSRLLQNFVFDKASRRPDGTFFVPKPLQRLFDVRTQRAEVGENALSVKLSGRIIADPNARGDVEASLLGRIEAPKTGLPVLGEEVKQGQILGYVTPAVGVVDRTQVRREVARLTNEIRQTAESLEILKQFWFVPFRDGKIIQSEMKLEGLRRERAALMPMLQTQEVLKASTDGVISASNAITGRIVHPGEKIFEIVNPKKLWVEAIAADPEIAKTAASVDSAVAMTPEGHTLDIGFVGSGLALQQQAVPLMFRIDQPIEGLRVGRPVTVAIRSKEKGRSGIAVPREAVVVGSNGLEQVWEHVEPEVFVPRTVKTEAVDGRTVLVVAGLSPGAQIVTRGTRLLVQLQ